MQINSFFYEINLPSKNKDKVSSKIHKLEKDIKPEDLIKDADVLEFS